MHIRLPVAAAVAFLMGAIVGVQAAGTSTVVQRALVFGKASLSPAKGDRITFTNEDDVIHNIHIFGPCDDQKDLGPQKRDAQLHLRQGRLLHGPLQHPSIGKDGGDREMNRGDWSIFQESGVRSKMRQRKKARAVSGSANAKPRWPYPPVTFMCRARAGR
jgi:hypothetical protein